MIAAAALYVHLAKSAAQVNDAHLSPVPSLSVVTAAAPAVSFPFEPHCKRIVSKLLVK